jgi:hypothetical protein
MKRSSLNDQSSFLNKQLLDRRAVVYQSCNWPSKIENRITMATNIFSFIKLDQNNTLKVLLVFLFFFVLANSAQVRAQDRWEGPWKDSNGWNCWRAAMGDGSTMWVWDSGKGERKVAYDKNNDGRFETWQEIFSLPNQPVLAVYHWDENQDNRDEAMAWLDGNNWTERVWDSNNDGLLDSWCRYDSPEYAQGRSAGKNSFSLAEKKNTHDAAYRTYLSQSQNTLSQKWAYVQYVRANLIFRICKIIALQP